MGSLGRGIVNVDFDDSIVLIFIIRGFMTWLLLFHAESTLLHARPPYYCGLKYLLRFIVLVKKQRDSKQRPFGCERP